MACAVCWDDFTPAIGPRATMKTSRLVLVGCVLAAGSPVLAQDKELSAKDKEAKEWVALVKYIELSLPQPNGKGLIEESRSKIKVKKVYFDDDAKEAAQLEVRPIKGLEEKLAGFVKTHILRMHLAGVTAVRSEDVSVFLKTLSPVPQGLSTKERALVEALQKGKDEDKAPKQGWIIEVRGYTYNHKGADFVRDTLVENLATLDEVVELTEELQEIRDRVAFAMLYRVHKAKYATDKEDGASPLKKSPLKALADADKLGRGVRAVEKATFKKEESRGKEEPVLRTEFAVIFLWLDPVVEKKKDE
jgi:hypothetical protein